MHELPEILPQPWQPRSLPRPRAPRQRHPWVMAAILAGHVGALLLVARGMTPQAVESAKEQITEVRFVTTPVAAPVPVPDPPQQPEKKPLSRLGDAKPKKPTPTRVRPTQRPTAAARSDSLIAVEPATRSREPLQLYDRNGRIQLPEGLIEQLDAQSGDKRVFDYQVPGLATSGTFFDRPPALVYEHNRFEKFYRPDQDLLTELLTKIVEGTTKEVRIKIPGNPRAKLVCSVSLLALGGGCGVQQNQGNYVIEDDPNTLSTEEQAQCRAWWDKIVDAKSQAVWLKTRDLYEQECRKPLERKPPIPPGQELMPGRITY